MRVVSLVVAVAVLAMAVLAWGRGRAADPLDWRPDPVERDGFEAVATVEDGRLVLHTAGGSRTFFTGVNVGPTIPGTQPGEQAIPREVFARWLPQIHGLGLRVVRVYTVMPPAFYEELRAFNLDHPSSPLYVVHGVWLPQALFEEHRDLFHPAVRDAFLTEVDRAVDVVHGDAVLPERLGHAGGSYSADVSDWLLGWLVGVEWDPLLTAASDDANRDVGAFDGTYFRAVPGSTPTEVWLATAMDRLASAEASRGRTMPIAFVNWPTTDPLDHPYEPLPREDLVGVDANHVLATDAWPGGTFASYHAYPYYPDFQRHEPGIADFELNGRADSYAGYLTQLRDHHAEAGLPVLVTEVGVPSSIGNAHFGPQGRDQGGHSEAQAMAINADLVRTISDVGLQGAFLFEWVDEWFKFTWNTIDLELPGNRRQLWSNQWTNEAHFGLVAVEPGAGGPVVTVDGDGSDWEDAPAQTILESRHHVREVRAVVDEEYLYLSVTVDGRWRDDPLVLGFDLVDGGAPLPGTDGGWDRADTAVVIDAGAGGQAYIRAAIDPVSNIYGAALGLVPEGPEDVDPDAGAWKPQRLIVNRPLTIPATGEELPAELVDVGRLVRGVSDPGSPKFDSRTTWAAEGSTVELRLPHASLGFADPSSLLAYSARPDGSVDVHPVERVGIAISHGGPVQATRGYAWDAWNTVTWHERPKAGLDVLAEALAEVEALGSR